MFNIHFHNPLINHLLHSPPVSPARAYQIRPHRSHMPTSPICNFSKHIYPMLSILRFTIPLSLFLVRRISWTHHHRQRNQQSSHRQRQHLTPLCSIDPCKNLKSQITLQFNHHTAEFISVARRALLPRAPVLHCVCPRGAKVCKCLKHPPPPFGFSSDHTLLSYTTRKNNSKSMFQRVPKQIITNYGFARSNLPHYLRPYYNLSMLRN